MSDNDMRPEEVKHFAEALVDKQSLTSLKYVPPEIRNHHLSVAVDGARFSFLRSLDGNQLCGLNHRGQGTYTAEGIIAITEMLKVNTALQSIRCARGARFLTKRQ